MQNVSKLFKMMEQVTNLFILASCKLIKKTTYPCPCRWALKYIETSEKCQLKRIGAVGHNACPSDRRLQMTEEHTV